MINFENKTPFETSITIHGETRLLINNPLCTKDISSPPPKCKWFSEWIKILYFGPLYKNISFCIEPWCTFQLSITSDMNSSITMGFNDVCTNWKKHVPGIYSWDSKAMNVVISCVPGKFNLSRNRGGPMIARDIPLNIKTESDNESWKVIQVPITMVQFSPTFNDAYYKRPK